MVTNEWKNIKNIIDNNKFINAVSPKKKKNEKISNKRRERKHEQILHDCQKRKICSSFFDTSSVPATSTENPLSNDVTPPSSTSAISVDCTEQKSIPVVSTPTNQKQTPKQDELSVAVGVEKDILLLHHKKCNPGLLPQEDRKELKSCEKNS